MNFGVFGLMRVWVEPACSNDSANRPKATQPTAPATIRKAQVLAESALRPVALLLTRDLMWEEP